MPVLTDEDVGLGAKTLTDADVGLGEAPAPEEPNPILVDHPGVEGLSPEARARKIKGDYLRSRQEDMASLDGSIDLPEAFREQGEAARKAIRPFVSLRPMQVVPGLKEPPASEPLTAPRGSVREGLEESITGLLASPADPSVGVPMALTAVSGMAPVMAPYWAYHGAKGLPGSIAQTLTGETPSEKVQGGLQTAMNILMAGGPFKGLRAPKAKAIPFPEEAPPTGRELKTPTGVRPPPQSAVAEQMGEPLAGDVTSKLSPEAEAEAAVKEAMKAGGPMVEVTQPKKPWQGSISFESYDEPTGKWEPTARPIVISKSTIPGDKPWRATVFAGGEDMPTAIGHVQLEHPEITPEATKQLSEQLGRYTRNLKIERNKPAPLTESTLDRLEAEGKAPEATKDTEADGLIKQRERLFGDIGESLNEWLNTATPEQVLEKYQLGSKMLTGIEEEIAQRKKLGYASEKELFPLRYDVDGITSVLERRLMTAENEKATETKTNTEPGVGESGTEGGNTIPVSSESVKAPEKEVAVPPLERAMEIEKDFNLEPADAHFFNVALDAVAKAPEKWTTLAEGIQKEALRSAVAANGSLAKVGDLKLAKQIADKYLNEPLSKPAPETVVEDTYYQAGETKARGGVQYISESPELAAQYAEGGTFGRPGARVEKIAAKLNIFDGSKASPAEQESILGKAGLRYVEPDGNINFNAFEADEGIKKRLKDAGYDAIRISEGENGTSIAVLEHAKEKLKKQPTPSVAPKVEPPLEVEVAKPSESEDIPFDLAAEIEKQKTGNGPLSNAERGELNELRGIKKERGKLGMLNSARLEHLESREKLTPITEPPQPPSPEGPSPQGKWTSATDEGALGGQVLMGIPDPIKTYKAAVALTKAGIKALAPKAQSAAESIRQVAHEVINTSKMTDYRRSVLNWSAKLQRSFGEAAESQTDIRKRVPDAVKRDGITNWIQADGDKATLTARRDATVDPKLRAGYEAALNLAPEELAVAQDVKNAYAVLGARGNLYDVLNSFKENYVTQVWNLPRSSGGGGARILKERFKFSRASSFLTFFDGEQAGFSPKTKDISKLLPVYLHEMNSVIAARQLVQEMSKGKASDGRPLVSPRGTGVPVEGEKGKATLIMPKAVKGETGDYKTMENQPALTDWRWASKDEAGNPIFLKADLALHPEAYSRMKAVLGRSAIREWYNTKTSATAQIPKAIVKGIDIVNSETKRTMLGLLSTFHHVQEGFHGIGHRVSPVSGIPKIDLVYDAAQMDAAKHGLMILPDRASEGQFMEGLRPSGLVSKIPVIGPLSDMYSNYLFHKYIPGLKYKTYEAALKRNEKVFADKVASGEVKPEEVKTLSAEQVNAAYGHLNYADLGRNPTIQHLAQIFLLAPDFLEARGRFAGQALRGATGAKVGREQMIALATLAIAQATGAWIGAKTTGGEWDPKHPFEFTHGTRKYTLRSVPEDITGLVSNARQFVNNRLSPVTQTIEQLRTGRDWRGQKVTAAQTAKEALVKPLPLTLRSLPGLRHLSGSDRPGSLSPLEQFAGALGLRISRAESPYVSLQNLSKEWMRSSTDPKVRHQLERGEQEDFGQSDYKPLREALRNNDLKLAREEYEKLLPIKHGESRLTQTGKMVLPKSAHEQIAEVLRPWSGKVEQGNLREKSLLGLNQAEERKFMASLSARQKKLVDQAKKERSLIWQRFNLMLREKK